MTQPTGRKTTGLAGVVLVVLAGVLLVRTGGRERPPRPVTYRHPRRGRLYAWAGVVVVVAALGWCGFVSADADHAADRPLGATAWGMSAVLPMLLHRAGAVTVVDARGVRTRGGLAVRRRFAPWPEVTGVTVKLTHRWDGAVHRVVAVRADGRAVPLATPVGYAWRPSSMAALGAAHARVVEHWEAAGGGQTPGEGTGRRTRVTKPSVPR
ncbi:PH domain-containing protein [Streptomyces sp. WMMC1477]|uniref:PH domain-containing protein n=1 Tax=Streptomyces sp. WMMC1477 TaxID=3015155 RepID=UPI0022B5F448|nr:PH domain-containing protein [Streptomyces sp. WMMC1477]MCZ7433140.1 hypothetical protein [Streptomyces sp. WMMC1477]